MIYEAERKQITNFHENVYTTPPTCKVEAIYEQPREFPCKQSYISIIKINHDTIDSRKLEIYGNL